MQQLPDLTRQIYNIYLYITGCGAGIMRSRHVSKCGAVRRWICRPISYQLLVLRRAGEAQLQVVEVPVGSEVEGHVGQHHARLKDGKQRVHSGLAIGVVSYKEIHRRR